MTPSIVDSSAFVRVENMKFSQSHSFHYLLAATSAALVLGIVGCSSPDTSEPVASAPSTSDSASGAQPQEATTTTTTTTTKATTTAVETPSKTDGQISLDTSSLQQVDAQEFSQGSTKMFYVTLGAKKGECFFNGEVVSCFGKADSSVPEVEVAPFPKQAPSSIVLSEQGAAYTLAEGIPPTQNLLDDGQWIDFGSVQCGKPKADQLVCQSDNAAFAIEGEEKNIRTSGKVFDSVEELSAQ